MKAGGVEFLTQPFRDQDLLDATSENTVKIHRHRVMEKMGANSLPELVQMADRLEVLVPKA